jgi:hypothetical protein
VTIGHILTIVQNMIVGQKPFWNNPQGIDLRSIINHFSPSLSFRFFMAGCGGIVIDISINCPDIRLKTIHQ